MNKEVTLLLIGQSLPLTLSVFEQLKKEYKICGVIEFTSKSSLSNKRTELMIFAESVKAEYRLFLKNDDQATLKSFYQHIKPDIAFVCSMPALLKEDLISLPGICTINVHPSFLPAYKGPNPKFWIYYYAEKYGGVSVHYVDKGEDSGNIISQKKFNIPLGLPSSQYDDLIRNTACQIANEAVAKAINGDTGIVQKNDSPAIRARRVKKGETFNDCIDWEIERTFHFLVGTEYIPPIIKVPPLVSKLFNVKIATFKKEDKNSEKKIATFSFDMNGCYFQHKEGRIYFNLKPKGISRLKRLTLHAN
jgi:methionyl-tRNA formyltransferase